MFMYETDVLIRPKGRAFFGIRKAFGCKVDENLSYLIHHNTENQIII